MIDTNALKGIIAKNNLSQRKLAKMLGMTEKTFYSKMAQKKFQSNEMQEMVNILKIKEPARIFFASSVT